MYIGGACWAMSATSALSDRIMIHYNNSFPEWNLSPQVLLNVNERTMDVKYTKQQSYPCTL